MESDTTNGKTEKSTICRVDTSGLQEVGSSKSLVPYLKEIWARRDYITADAKAKAFRTTRDYKWWRFWLIGSPLLEALLYGFMFGVLLKTSRGVENFVGFVIIGITLFGAMNRLLMAGVGLIEANKGMIRAFSFPTATITISVILRYIYDLTPSVIIASIVALLFQLNFTPPGATVFFAVIVFALTFLFGAGLTFITARLTSFLPDFRAILELFSRGWMFASGIFYSMEHYATNPLVYNLFSANPAYQYITAFRKCLLYNQIPSVSEWTSLFCWGIGTFSFGILFFWQAEDRYKQES